MKKYLFYSLALTLSLGWFGCGSDDELPPEVLDTSITIFEITAPFQAVGVIDNSANTVTMDYPFGEDVSAVTVEATLPAGASISPSNPVDFSGGPVTFTVTNGSSSTTYTVTLNEGANPLRLVLLGDGAYASLDAEIKTAYDWALAEYQERASYIQFSDLSSTDISTATAMWFHYTVFPRQPDLNGDDFFTANEVLPASASSAASEVESFVKGGGNVLLTGLTGSYIAAINRVAEEFGPTNYDTGGEEFIDNPDCWGVSYLPTIFNSNDYPAGNDNYFVYNGVTTTSYTFEGVTYDGICLSTGGSKKNRAHIWDFNRYFEGTVLPGCDDPNAKKTEYEAQTGALVRSSFEWDPAACGVELGAIVEFPAQGEFTGDCMVIGLGAYEWEMRDGRTRPETVDQITKNVLDRYIN